MYIWLIAYIFMFNPKKRICEDVSTLIEEAYTESLVYLKYIKYWKCGVHFTKIHALMAQGKTVYL